MNQLNRQRSSNVQPVRLSRVRKQATKYCEVCGDTTKGNHFGGLCCNSCKAFFRRSVYNKNYLGFCCSRRGKCAISTSTRKDCRYCRIHRCFAIGMEEGLVLTEKDRHTSIEGQYKLRARQFIKTSTRANLLISYSSSISEINQVPSNPMNYSKQRIERLGHFLSTIEIKEIELILTNFSQVYHQQAIAAGDDPSEIFKVSNKLIYNYWPIICNSSINFF